MTSRKRSGHAGLWHSSLNFGTQYAQAFRIFEPIERRDHNARLSLLRLKAQIGIARGSFGGSAISAIEPFCQAGDFGFRIQRAIEGLCG
jgi:hypothetical protein